MRSRVLRLGVIGYGNFGRFAVRQFTQVPHVVVTAIAVAHPERARALPPEARNAQVIDVESLIRRSDVDVVYIATPPFLHHRQSLLALRAGKHVLCEKPLALTLEQAEEMIDTARSEDCLLAVDFLQRYHPLHRSVKTLLETRLLGELLHGDFENTATDAQLPPEHWFWDHDKSGGIFVEHGVHFFDLFRGWLGPGTVRNAVRTLRPALGSEEHVLCTMQYGNTALVHFYHGFHQPLLLERQEMRLLFERGDVTLYDWIPTHLRIRALVDDGTEYALRRLFPDGDVYSRDVGSLPGNQVAARHSSFSAARFLELQTRRDTKERLYGVLLQELFKDQMTWIEDRSHKRQATEEDGREALRIALEADRQAHAVSPGA